MEAISPNAILYSVSPKLSDEELNALMTASWPGEHAAREFGPVLGRSLAYFTAHDGDRLIGFVNLAWDGGEHAFLLDLLVHPDFRHRGIGTELVMRTISKTRSRRIKWLHVDFEPHLKGFYTNCGFRHTEAGLIRFFK